MEIKDILHKSASKRLFCNGIHSFIKRTDVRGSADVIYGMWRISLVYMDT